MIRKMVAVLSAFAMLLCMDYPMHIVYADNERYAVSSDGIVYSLEDIILNDGMIPKEGTIRIEGYTLSNAMVQNPDALFVVEIHAYVSANSFKNEVEIFQEENFIDEQSYTEIMNDLVYSGNYSEQTLSEEQKYKIRKITVDTSEYVKSLIEEQEKKEFQWLSEKGIQIVSGSGTRLYAIVSREELLNFPVSKTTGYKIFLANSNQFPVTLDCEEIISFSAEAMDVPSESENKYIFVVTQIEENHAILMEVDRKLDGKYVYFDVSDWSSGNQFFTNNFSDMQKGDILEFEGTFSWTSDIGPCLFIEPEGTIFKTGSVMDNPQIKTFTESYIDEMGWSFISEDDKSYPLCIGQALGFHGRISTYYTYQGIPVLLNDCICNAKGDFNNDGTVDIMDVIAVNRYIVGVRDASPAQQMAVDINQNGDVDANDSLSILKIVLNVTD